LLTIWEATQMPHRCKAVVVSALGLSETQVRVVTPDVGGGFGPKGTFHPESLAVPTAAMILGAPIKWIEDRYENFLANVLEQDQEWDMHAAFDADGRLLGIKGQLFHDHGANTPYGIALPYNSGTNLIGPYPLPAYDLKIALVLTNKVPASATRGAGRSQGTFVMERLLDLAADRLAITRVEIRRRNFIPRDKLPYEFPVRQRDGAPMTYDSGDYAECQRRALARAGLEDFEKRRAQARKEGRRLGLGVSAYVEATGRGPYESGAVRIGPSGKIIVTTGASAQGQGTKTMLAQITADVFNVPIDRVQVIVGDTAASPLGLGAYASRQTVTAGNAVHAAARAVADKAKRVAAEMLEASADDIEIFDGVLRVKGVPDLHVTLKDAATALAGVPGFVLPGNMAPGLAASVDFQPDGMTYSNGSHVAEVEVDVDSGLVKLNRYIVAHDCGTIISPSGVEGQTIGGVVHGIGATLFEWMRYDENGQPLAVTYADYLLPTSDVVPRIEIEHMQSPSPFNPLGVKGAGEAGTIGAPAAIIAAVEDALADYDIFITDLPLTPVRLFELLKSAQRKSGRS
jgi:carbon-monoxide dehydrogenase large subunit